MKTRDMTDKDRTKISHYIEEHWSTPWIVKKFRSKYTTQQIASVRAWNKMNANPKKYFKKKKDLTATQRAFIIGFINEGYTTPEILKKMKRKISRQQIAAVRAWRTMGKY